jgi:hypothetical protein
VKLNSDQPKPSIYHSSRQLFPNKNLGELAKINEKNKGSENKLLKKINLIRKKRGKFTRLLH